MLFEQPVTFLPPGEDKDWLLWFISLFILRLFVHNSFCSDGVKKLNIQSFMAGGYRKHLGLKGKDTVMPSHLREPVLC